MKPIDLIAHSLKLSSIKGDLVIDGFLGSGSTLMACELTGSPLVRDGLTGRGAQQPARQAPGSGTTFLAGFQQAA